MVKFTQESPNKYASFVYSNSVIVSSVRQERATRTRWSFIMLTAKGVQMID